MARRKIAPSDIKVELLITDEPADGSDVIGEIFELLLSFADESDQTAD